MVFRPEPTVYKLSFDEDTGLAGLSCRVACCSIGEFNEMLRGTEPPQIDEAVLDNPEEMAKLVQQMTNIAADANDRACELFLEYLIEWDLGDKDGNVVPKTMEGVSSVERPVIMKIIAAWQMAMTAVPPPLKKASTNGRSSEEASLGLGTSSASPASWPEQR